VIWWHRAFLLFKVFYRTYDVPSNNFQSDYTTGNIKKNQCRTGTLTRRLHSTVQPTDGK
jgi:hypothetical protein